MDDKYSLDCSCYSFKPLPREIIKFYDNPFESAMARKRLEELTIFFWRDDENGRGILLNKDCLEREVFHNVFILDKDTWSIDYLEEDNEGEQWKFEDDEDSSLISNLDNITLAKKPRFNDKLSWLIFNDSVVLRSINSKFVSRY